MRKKLFTFLLALAASIGMMWAENPVVVTINKSEFTSSGVTKDGVTLARSSGSMTSSDVIAMDGSFEFSTSLGKFTSITIVTDANIMQIYENGYTSAGWPTGQNLGTSAAWTGESETVLISCMVAGMDNITITCTIEPAPAPTYTVALEDGTVNADKVTLSATSAEEGATITVTPDEEYEVTAFSATYAVVEDQVGTIYTIDATLNPATGAYSFTMPAANVTIEATIAEKAAPTPQPEGDGKLSGAFTINADGDQILFSKGNLQYQASTTTWRFATNQYDLIGADNANISDTYTGWIDLFGWGTGNNPAKKSTDDEDYSTFTDWGVNAISNGGNEANLWRTMTRYEWAYLIQTRTNAADLKGQATVADVHGFVLLPDSWTLPAGLSFTPSPNNWTTNDYTAEQWTQMEAAGAVFLPAAGYREPEIEGVGEKGWYWSSTPLTDIISYHFEFNETTSRVFGGRIYFGQPVRLVTAAPAVAPTPTTEEIITNGDPENPGTYYYSTFFHSTQNYKLTNDGTQAFIADLSGSDLVLTEIANGTQVIPANTAVILRKTGSADPVVLTPTEENGVSFSAHNSLEGVDAETAVTSIDGLTTTNCYVLSGTAQYGVGFYRILGSELKAHKAYVKYAGLQTNAPRRMRFVFNEEKVATGVENTDASVKIGGSEKVIENGQLIIIKNGVRYNAQGQIVK